MSTTEPQSAESKRERPPFQFRLRTLLLLFVVLASSLAVFGAWGIVVFGLVVVLAVYLNRAKSFRLPTLLLLPMVIVVIDTVGMFIAWAMPAIAIIRRQGCQQYWPNIAALAVWLLSVGTLLTHAVRSRRRSSVPPTPLAR